MQLEIHMRADSLNEKLAHRTFPGTLMKEDLLQGDPHSPEDRRAEAIGNEYTKREHAPGPFPRPWILGVDIGGTTVGVEVLRVDYTQMG
ncbi:hypothetical protein C8A03DRAFT_13866 [Achaetomium macrosporum]|uniref:Uncharacterized protein n=1 Tax=Achaetomium macrosporum TaxID=79813 RepID=A0AAN7CD43_9PEZI|nr:hypothetical protein C8A03DRAFT_13866 [Achaetomium macrosporum]